MAENENQPAPVIYARFAIDGDVIDVAEATSAFAQAVIDRLGRQSRPMLDPPEAFLLGRGDELPSRIRQAAESPW